MNFRNSEFLPRGFLYPFFVNRCSWHYYNLTILTCQHENCTFLTFGTVNNFGRVLHLCSGKNMCNFA
nr:MAG TPA: hypothetical protein [Caudoviricetes sp.]